MVRTAFAAALALVVAWSAPQAARANLVDNGNFATGDLTDWSLWAYNFSFGPGNTVTQQNVNAAATFQINHGCCGANVTSTLISGQNTWTSGADLFYQTIVQSIATIPGHVYETQYIFSFSGGAGAYVPGTLLGIFGNQAFLAANSWIGCGANPGCTPSHPGSGAPLSGTPVTGSTYRYAAGTYDESFIATATDDTTLLEFAAGSLGQFGLTDIIVTDITAVAEPASLALFAPVLLLFWRRRARSAAA